MGPPAVAASFFAPLLAKGGAGLVLVHRRLDGRLPVRIGDVAKREASTHRPAKGKDGVIEPVLAGIRAEPAPALRWLV